MIFCKNLVDKTKNLIQYTLSCKKLFDSRIIFIEQKYGFNLIKIIVAG